MSRAPGNASITTILVMGGAIVAAKLAYATPDLLIRPNVVDLPHARLLPGVGHFARGGGDQGRVKEQLGALLRVLAPSSQRHARKPGIHASRHSFDAYIDVCVVPASAGDDDRDARVNRHHRHF